MHDSQPLPEQLNSIHMVASYMTSVNFFLNHNAKSSMMVMEAFLGVSFIICLLSQFT
jgi:hypothetical protein